VSYIRTEATAWLSDDERRDLAELLGPAESTVEIEPLPPPRPVVREWTMEDLAGGLEAASHGRDFERGQALYAEALCNRCHRLGDRGRAQGPDLTGVAKRFNTHDLLVSIVQPSKVIDEKYRGAVLETRDGQAITGRIVGGSETVLLVATDPLDPRQTREVPLADIETQAPAPLSIMPAGLLNTLTRDEILDLLAYVQANGDREHPSFEE
jgi:putative heme-binding domain-containing protein